MKIIWVLAVLAALLFSGCAGMMFETGVRKEIQVSNPLIIKPEIIYYKSALHKSGFQRFNQVSKRLEQEPSRALIEFKNAFLANATSIFKEEGYTFVEAPDNPSENLPVYVEIRLAFQRGVPPLIPSVAATRWFVYFNGEYAFEIYEWEQANLIGIGGEKSAGQDLSKKSIKDFLKKIEKIFITQSQQ